MTGARCRSRTWPARRAPQFIAPRSPLEQQIAEVWREVLELDQVSVHESFFDLGGHSIRGVALVGALRAAGLDASVRDVFEHRTIAELAAVLAARTELSEDTGSVPPFALISAPDKERLPGDVTDAYPLSYVQRGMLAEMLADPSRSIYRDCASFQVRDDRPLSLAALEQAVQVVVDRHEILRTSFDLDGYPVPLQLVHARAQLPVSLVDLRGLTEAEQELAVRRLHQRERAAMFDLGKPPLMRLTALIQGDQAWRLAFTQLHAITEGWSFHSMLMEVLSCYRRLRDGLAAGAISRLPRRGTPTSSRPSNSRWSPSRTGRTGRRSWATSRSSPCRPPGPAIRGCRATTTA